MTRGIGILSTIKTRFETQGRARETQLLSVNGPALLRDQPDFDIRFFIALKKFADSANVIPFSSAVAACAFIFTSGCGPNRDHLCAGPSLRRKQSNQLANFAVAGICALPGQRRVALLLSSFNKSSATRLIAPVTRVRPSGGPSAMLAPGLTSKPERTQIPGPGEVSPPMTAAV